MRTAILVAVVATAFGQPGSQPYAGVWTAEHAGNAYVRLELHVTDGILGGRLSLADIHVDAEGNLSVVLSAVHEPMPIFDITVRDQMLVFSRKDGDDTDHFEMRLTGGGLAELRFVPSDADRRELAENGTAVPKPFRLTRIAP
jgi:hypothetical protein